MGSYGRSKDRRSIAIAQVWEDFDRLVIQHVRYIEADIDEDEEEDEKEREAERQLARRGHRASTIAYVKRLRAVYDMHGIMHIDFSLLSNEDGEVDPSEWVATLFDGEKIPGEALRDFATRAHGVDPQCMRLERLLIEEIEEDVYQVGAVIEVTAIARE
jgi:hypothetical protein